MVLDINLEDCFRQLGIAPSDTIMLHGDAGPIAQLWHLPANERSQRFVEDVEAFSGQATGRWSCRHSATALPRMKPSMSRPHRRTSVVSAKFSDPAGMAPFANPNFSIVARGRHEDAFASSSFDDSFGKGTAFDLLYELDAQIVCFGCSFNRVTFLHYLEQAHGISYRFFKEFPGTIVNGDHRIETVARYYVRDLDLETSCDLDDLYKTCLEEGSLKEAVFGRFPVAAIRPKPFSTPARRCLRQTNTP